MPLSDHCRSSITTASGDRAAASSRAECRSCSTQYRTSVASPSCRATSASITGRSPDDSAGSSGAKGTVCWVSYASPNRTRTPARSAIPAASASSAVLPIPGGPSTSSTCPRPRRSLARAVATAADSASRPRSTGARGRLISTARGPRPAASARPCPRVDACRSADRPHQEDRVRRREQQLLDRSRNLPADIHRDTLALLSGSNHGMITVGPVALMAGEVGVAGDHSSVSADLLTRARSACHRTGGAQIDLGRAFGPQRVVRRAHHDPVLRPVVAA